MSISVNKNIRGVRWLLAASVLAVASAAAPALAQAGSSAGASPVTTDPPPTGVPASSQDAGTTAADTGSGLGDIIVTAQRRNENLQAVPVAITAFSPAVLVQNGIHDLNGIAVRTPGLTFSPFAPGQNIIAMRGVSSNDDGAGTDSSVAVFIDGVYNGRLSNVNPQLIDVQSVEVLRGPQGALYGKNTIGGAIVINTTTPSVDKASQTIKYDIGNYGLMGVSGIVSQPLGDGWAVKLAISELHRDGYTYDRVTHSRENDDNQQYFHLQVLHQGEKLTALLSANFSLLNVADEGRVPLTQITGNIGPVVDEYNAICGDQGPPRCAANPVKGYSHRQQGGISLKLDYETSLGTVTSLTAYQQSHINWDMDSVGVPQFPLGNIVMDGDKQASQELRLTGTTASDRLKYAAGLFYLYEDTDRTRIFDFPGLGNIAADSRYRQHNRLNSYAAYGQVDWTVLPKLILTASGRFTYETKNIFDDTVAGNFPIIENSFTANVGAHWQHFTPKGTISYHPSSTTTLYATVAGGFKSGGFAAAPTSIEDTVPLKQETATNYEAGFKTQFLNNTVRFNAAAFYTHYRNLQYQSFGPRPGIAEFGVFRTSNLDSSRVYGVEAEGEWQPFSQLLISGNYGYLNSKYLNAIISNADYPNQDGQELIRAPKHKWSANAEFIQPLSNGSEVRLSGGYAFTGTQRGELEPYALQPRFGLANARLTWISPGKGVELAGWIQNLADRTYVTHIYTIGGEVLGVFGQPRSYGFTLTLRH